MPNFKKSKGYKMKGSKFFGKNGISPLKVSDEAVVSAQDKLDHIELDWKEPGWAKAAKSVFSAPHEKMGGGGGAGGAAKAAGEVAGAAKGGGDKKSVSDIAKSNSDLPGVGAAKTKNFSTTGAKL